MAWDGSEFAGQPDLYTYTLSEEDLLEVRAALSHFKGLFATSDKKLESR